MVSQLTSRGTWRHLVPLLMTVTEEGRARTTPPAASAVTSPSLPASSRTVGGTLVSGQQAEGARGAVGAVGGP